MIGFVELKPCPFCGGKAEMLDYKYENKDVNEFIVSCSECGASVGEWRKTEEEAIINWNTRKPIVKALNELEELENLAEKRYKGGTSKHALQEHNCYCKAIDIVKGYTE